MRTAAGASHTISHFLTLDERSRSHSTMLGAEEKRLVAIADDVSNGQDSQDLVIPL